METRRLYIRPVVPESPVRVAMLMRPTGWTRWGAAQPVPEGFPATGTLPGTWRFQPGLPGDPPVASTASRRARCGGSNSGSRRARAWVLAASRRPRDCSMSIQP